MTSMIAEQTDAPGAERKVSFLLAVGIIVLPGIFVWFLLRHGHSTLSRVLGFGWAGILLVSTQSVIAGINSLPDAPREEPTASHPEASATEVPAEEATNEPITSGPASSPPATPVPTEPTRPVLSDEQRRGMHCLNNWDGSHWDMQRAIKRQLRNPVSFEHVETRIAPIDEAGNHSVFMTYRAENGFGGMNVQQAIGVVDNKHCELTALQM